MEKLERSMESLRTVIADREQQAVAKDRQIEGLTAEFLALRYKFFTSSQAGSVH